MFWRQGSYSVNAPMYLYPLEVVGHFSIDSRLVRPSTPIPPADNAKQCRLTPGLAHHGTTAVSLTTVHTTGKVA